MQISHQAEMIVTNLTAGSTLYFYKMIAQQKPKTSNEIKHSANAGRVAVARAQVLRLSLLVSKGTTIPNMGKNGTQK